MMTTESIKAQLQSMFLRYPGVWAVTLADDNTVLVYVKPGSNISAIPTQVSINVNGRSWRLAVRIIFASEPGLF